MPLSGGGPGRTARCLAPAGVVAPGGPPSVRPAGHRVLTIECVNLQPPAPLLASLAHVPCIAKGPVDRGRTAAPPVEPGAFQAHLSAFSSPEESTQPPGGVWSVSVSAYSCPATIETPSSLPPPPERTKCAPHVAPTAVT